jgi:glycerophosphoryl diester phosphodiesterase
MRISLIALIVCVLGCSEVPPETSDIKIFGHGGAGFDIVNSVYAPNSVSSIASALDDYHLDGVEVDLQFTADSLLIVYHDGFLEGSTQCKGKISEIHSVDILSCKYRKQFSNRYEDGIISFDSLAILINDKWHNKYFSLNLKLNTNNLQEMRAYAKVYYRELQKITKRDKIRTECNDANFLLSLKMQSRSETVLLIHNLDSLGYKNVRRFNLDGVVTPFNEVKVNLAKSLISESKYVVTYNQKFARDYKSEDYRYITSVQVDNPILALKYFRNK